MRRIVIFNDPVLGKNKLSILHNLGFVIHATMDFLASHYAHLVSRDTQNRGYISEDLNIILISLSFFLYSLRMYSRFLVTKSPGLDDAIITIGLVSGTQHATQNTPLNYLRCLLPHSPSWKSSVRQIYPNRGKDN